MKPTRLEFLAVTRTARAVNPLLALDAKVDYGPIFKGLNSGNFKARKPTLLTDLKTALKGKTIAQDVDIEHVAKMLDHVEHVKEPKSLDESVSEPQHKAMEAAANGSSTLGIPKDVGKEFADADKGKTFDEGSFKDMLKTKGMSEDDIGEIMDMMPKPAAADEDPENALDEDEDEKKKREEKEAADKKAKDEEMKEKKAMDAKLKNMVSTDSMNEAIKSAVAAERANSRATAEAREFVRSRVGDLPMALDSAESVLREAAKALHIKNAEKINVDGLRTIIEMQPVAGAQPSVYEPRMAEDSMDDAGVASFDKLFPGAARIGSA